MSATVWKAICKPLGEVVAIKLLDLESLNVRIEEIIREVRGVGRGARGREEALGWASTDR